MSQSTYPAPCVFFALYDPARVGGGAIDLQRPPEPPRGNFIKFGNVQSAEHLVHDLGDVPQLYADDDGGDAEPNVNYARELRRLNRRAARQYAALLSDLIGSAPDLKQSIRSLNDVFINVAHLLNVLRAHQARQTVVRILQRQIGTRRAKIAQLSAQVDKARGCLQSHGIEYADDGSMLPTDDAVDMVVESAPAAGANRAAEAASSSSSSSDAVSEQQLVAELDELWRRYK